MASPAGEERLPAAPALGSSPHVRLGRCRGEGAMGEGCLDGMRGVLEHSYGKSPFLIGKSTINGPCSIATWKIDFLIGWWILYIYT